MTYPVVPEAFAASDLGHQLLDGQVTWRQIVGQLQGEALEVTGKRVCGGIRLSVYDGPEDDPSTSPVRQRLIIKEWAAREGNTIVGWAEDLDVSASKIPPFARPQLGDWLTYRTADYDVLAFWRLDRGIRNMNDMSDLTRWAKDNHKDLVFISGPGGVPFVLNMSSGPVAEFIAMAFAFAAQMESLAIAERVADTRAYLRRAGRYAGGWIPWPYMQAEAPVGKGFRLAPDPDCLPHALFMVDRILNDCGPTEIADMLNERGALTSKDAQRARHGKPPRGHKWTYLAVIQILRSRALCGITQLYPDAEKDRNNYRGTKHEIVRDDAGQPIRFGEPIIDDATWRRIQDKLNKISYTNRSPRKDSPWLVGLAYCQCGAKLYASRQTVNGVLYEYMKCSTYSKGQPARRCGHGELIHQAHIAAAIDAWVAENGTMAYAELRTVQGINHDAEIQDVTTAIKEIAAQLALADDDEDTEREQRQLTSLKARRKLLLAMPAEPDRVVFAQTSRTVAQHWDSLTRAEQRMLAVTRGIKFTVAVNAEPYRTYPRRRNARAVTVECDPGTLLQGAVVPLGPEGLESLRAG